jgi:hypothetical protein
MVGARHVAELLDVVWRYVGRERTWEFLRALAHTTAYRGSKSFRETVDALQRAHEAGGK